MILGKKEKGLKNLDSLKHSLQIAWDSIEPEMLRAISENAKRRLEAVVEARGDSRTLVEESPVRSSGSNGIVERAVQPVEGLIRTLKSGLEERLGFKVDAEKAVVAFMAEYAAYLQNRLFVGKDGKTAYERVKGKTAKVLGVEFGEKIVVESEDEWKDGKDQSAVGIRHFCRCAEEKWGNLVGNEGWVEVGQVCEENSV